MSKHKLVKMKQRYYTYPVSKNHPPRKVITSTLEEILKIASTKLNKDSKHLLVLDIGCGIGTYSLGLSRYVKKVIGVEPFTEAFEVAIKNKGRKKNVKFFNSLIEDFRSSDKFDLAISLSTLEHMPQAEKSFKRVFELLRRGGVLFITAPNKYWPMENHYRLPFLSYLPLPMANIYLRITGRGDSYEDCSYFRSYFSTRKLFDNLPCEYEFFLPDPNALYLGLGKDTSKWFRTLGIKLIRKFPIFWMISKGFIIIARKN